MLKKLLSEHFKKGQRIRALVTAVVFLSLLFSIVYAAIQAARSPSGAIASPGQRLKSDYVLMLLQCILGLALMFLPSLISRGWKIIIPSYMQIAFYVFLYAGIYLGEVRNFYYDIPHWDTLLHTTSGAMLGTLGFSIVDMLNRQDEIKLRMSPVFVALFAFCFAVTSGVLWEIYEFTVDSVARLNMQKYAASTGELLAGRAALMDTMKDLTVDTLGALIISVVGYISYSRQRTIARIDRIGDAF